MNERVKYAFFSPSMAYDKGASVWLNPDGDEVIATFVCDNENDTIHSWKDMESRGPVVKLVREAVSCVKPMTVAEIIKNFSPEKEVCHGFYSEKLDMMRGCSVYRGENGDEVRVTLVHPTRELPLEYTKYVDDYVYKGVVKEWLYKDMGLTFPIIN